MSNMTQRVTKEAYSIARAVSGDPAMHKLAFQDAPQENLQTWGRVTKLLIYGSAATAILLLIMAATLL